MSDEKYSIENVKFKDMPEKYVFDKDLVFGLSLLVVDSEYNLYDEKYQKISNDQALNPHRQETIEKFYKSTQIQNKNKALNEKKFIEKPKEFSIKEKINYFSKRVNDQKLSKAQRNYAQKRINELR